MSDPIMSISGESSLDIISNLPDNVIEYILGCLPIRDAIRTSILSTTWKDKWLTMPHLVFNKNTFKADSVDPQVEVVKVISQVLLQHDGPVLKFVLSNSHLRSCPTIDHWLGFLSRNGIKVLTLEIKTAQSHKMPSKFFSCQHLRHLRLSNCIVRPPSTFSGFKKLISITFERVSCSATSLKNLIANSPLLVQLSLLYMLDLQSLTINAPNLLHILFAGESESLCTINAPRLLGLMLYIYQHFGLPNQVEGNRSSSFFNLLGCLPTTIMTLKLKTNTSQLKVLEAGNILKNLPNTYSKLCLIELSSFCFENLDSVACALCLITNAPNLKEIQMYIKTSQSPTGDEQVLTWMKANLGISMKLNKLEIFKMTSMSGTKPEMEFIKFILDSSPVLRKVTITANKAHPSYNGNATLKELVSFSRASSEAKIIYLDKD